MSHVYMHAWALGCFCSHISTQTFQRAQTASLDSCAPSVVSLNLAVCRKVLESDARSVTLSLYQVMIALERTSN